MRVVPDVPMIARVRRWAGAPGALVALAVVLAVVQAAPLLFQQSIDGRAWHWWGYVAAVGASLPVMAVRRYPVAVLLVSITVSASYDLVEPVAPQPLWYGVLVGVYGLANWSGPWVRVVVFTLICGVGLATVGSLNTAMRGILMYVAAYALGRAAASAVPEPRRSPNRRSGWNGNVAATRSGPPNASELASRATCTTFLLTPSP